MQQFFLLWNHYCIWCCTYHWIKSKLSTAGAELGPAQPQLVYLTFRICTSLIMLPPRNCIPFHSRFGESMQCHHDFSSQYSNPFNWHQWLYQWYILILIWTSMTGSSVSHCNTSRMKSVVLQLQASECTRPSILPYSRNICQHLNLHM